MHFSDIHIHLAEVSRFEPSCDDVVFLPILASAHFKSDFEKMQQIAASLGDFRKQIFFTFGLHPQNPDMQNADFLRELAEAKKIAAIGECGFDAFDDKLAATIDAQKIAWNFQVDLAAKCGLPLLVHCRKALPLIFDDCKRLKKLRAVIFHSWPGSPTEAETFLRRGVNAYFAIGKQVLNGNKRALQSAALIPLERILCETDAPWQKLRGETETKNRQIRDVHGKVAELRGMCVAALAEICEQNFRDCLELA